MSEIKKIKEEYLAKLNDVLDQNKVNEIKTELFGKSGIITNKFKLGDGYSGNAYDIVSATRDGIVYPSLDPSIFELKFPNIDIEGRSVGSSSGGN